MLKQCILFYYDHNPGGCRTEFANRDVYGGRLTLDTAGLHFLVLVVGGLGGGVCMHVDRKDTPGSTLRCWALERWAVRREYISGIGCIHV